MQRTTIFVCYCHDDQERYILSLSKHLKPFSQQYGLQVWHEQHIFPGDIRLQKIADALQMTRVAIALVSANFFACDRIHRYELPILLAAAKQQQIMLIPVLLSPCAYHESPLAPFQCVNDLQTTLALLSEGEQERIWLKVIMSMKEVLIGSDLPNPLSPSVSQEGKNKPGEIHSAAYQNVLRWLNDYRALDSEKKKISMVLTVADMTSDFNEADKRHLRGRLHQIRMYERSAAVEDYITLVLGLLDDRVPLREMPSIFARLHETLPLSLRTKIMMHINQ
jgi:hypothetical protein